MKSTAVIKDHPIHPMLVSIPIGLFVGSLASDAIGLASGNRKLNDAGYRMMLGGLLGGLAAAVPGVIDFLTVVPPESEAEDTGRLHAISNVGALSLYGINALLRSRGGSLGISLALSSISIGVMTYAGWLGGNLVYRNQIGVDHLSADGTEHLTLPTVEGLAGDYVTVCRAGDLKKEQVALVVLNGERVALARVGDEKYVAFQDRCTHAGGPLSDGTLIGESIMCPWHGSQFGACSGNLECGPATEPIRTYEVRVQSGSVQVKAPAVTRRSLVQAGSLA